MKKQKGLFTTISDFKDLGLLLFLIGAAFSLGSFYNDFQAMQEEAREYRQDFKVLVNYLKAHNGIPQGLVFEHKSDKLQIAEIDPKDIIDKRKRKRRLAAKETAFDDSDYETIITK